MLGQPIPLLSPIVTGVRLVGRLPDEATPTDLALTVTQVLREKGRGRPVRGVLRARPRSPDAVRPRAGRQHVAGVRRHHGLLPHRRRHPRSTCARPAAATSRCELVEAYCRAQGLFRDARRPGADFTRTPWRSISAPSSPAWPGPSDRRTGSSCATFTRRSTRPWPHPPEERGFGVPAERRTATSEAGTYGTLRHGSVVIAAITSCTNTSNPQLMLGAGLLARKAVERGLKVPAYVKTSFAPGSRVVTEYLKKAGLLPYLEQLGFHVVAYGCTTCIGNSGPLKPEIEAAIRDGQLVAAAVLSGNRNFEGRIHPLTQANYLCSPPLVVAYALSGHGGHRPAQRPAGDGQRRETGLSQGPLAHPKGNRRAPCRRGRPGGVCQAVPRRRGGRRGLGTPGRRRRGRVRLGRGIDLHPRAFLLRGLRGRAPAQPRDIENASVLGYFGDFITTDHISPAGAIPKDSPAAEYLRSHGVAEADFNSFGSRRGNHEVMMRGTFANIRIRNLLADREGGYTRHHPSGETVSIYDAAMRYRDANTPLVVLAGKLYGAGSSRDWAAKGTYLLGVKAVIAESFERIHRSNLVEMGVLPLEFMDGAHRTDPGPDRPGDLFGPGDRRGPPPLQDAAGPRRHRRGRHEGVRRAVPARLLHRGGLLPPRGHPAVRPARHHGRGVTRGGSCPPG